MARRQTWSVGKLIYHGAKKNSTITIYSEDKLGNALLAIGTYANMPSSVSGYAYGCLYIASDTGNVYHNTGGATTCSFTTQGTTGVTGATGATGATGSTSEAYGVGKTPTATSTGAAGEIAYDTNYIYVCTSTNNWKRTAAIVAPTA